MQKELFAAEELEVWVLHPSVAQFLVRQIKSELQNVKARHQPRRQRRLAALVFALAAIAFGCVAINLTANRFEMFPVHSLRQLHQLVLHVENLVKP